jgi:hypothetical protein
LQWIFTYFTYLTYQACPPPPVCREWEGPLHATIEPCRRGQPSG